MDTPLLDMADTPVYGGARGKEAWPSGFRVVEGQSKQGLDGKDGQWERILEAVRCRQEDTHAVAPVVATARVVILIFGESFFVALSMRFSIVS